MEEGGMRGRMLHLVEVTWHHTGSIENFSINLAECISIILRSNMFSKLHRMAHAILVSSLTRAHIIGRKEFLSTPVQ